MLFFIDCEKKPNVLVKFICRGRLFVLQMNLEDFG